MNIIGRMAAARSAAVTCSASRHAAEIGETMARHGTCQMIADPVDAQEAGESIAATVAALWEARAEIEKLRAALNAIVPISCHQLHHAKKDRHAPGDPCPVEVRIEALRWATAP